VLQEERIKKYMALQLTEYDATVLTEDKTMADYFETVISHTPNSKAAANWMLGPVKTWLNENNQEIEGFPIVAEQLARLIQLVDAGKLSFSMASSGCLRLCCNLRKKILNRSP
jgi:aspartyl-tRNA(Asn)/glutamyl-tRNA(Gln) amidotransferase subunit B